MKVAHFVNFRPNASGLHATTRDLTLLEREIGLDAQIIDWQGKETGYSKVWAGDGRIETVSPDWAFDADILVRHSAIPERLQKTGKPVIMSLHGRPDYLVELGRQKDYHVLKEVDMMHRNMPNYVGFLTYWNLVEDFWKLILPDMDICNIGPIVDLQTFNPNGPKTSWNQFHGNPNILIADMWREDTTPAQVLIAAAKFIKEHCPKGRVHIVGGPDFRNPSLNVLIGSLQQQKLIGSAAPLVENMPEVYRASDFVVTQNHIATRIVREALACGTPVLAPIPYDYDIDGHIIYNPNDIKICTSNIADFYHDLMVDPKKIKIASRKIAENNFAGQRAKEILPDFYQRKIDETTGKVQVTIPQQAVGKLSIPVTKQNKFFFFDAGEFGWALQLAAHVRWLKQCGAEVLVSTYPGREKLFDMADAVEVHPENFYEKFDTTQQEMYGIREVHPQALIDFFKSYNFKLPDYFTLAPDCIPKEKMIFESYEADADYVGNKNIVIFPRCRQGLWATRNLPKIFYRKLIAKLCETFPKYHIITLGVKSGAYDISLVGHSNYENGVSDSLTVNHVVNMLSNATVAIGSQSGPMKLALLQKVPCYMIGHESRRHTKDDNWMNTQVKFYVTKYNDFEQYTDEVIQDIIKFVNEYNRKDNKDVEKPIQE